MRERSFVRDTWVLAAFAAGLVLRLVHLGTAPLWLDEVITAEWLPLRWGPLVGTVLHDNHPPLYFLLLKAWTIVAGDSAWALRLPSALVSTAAIPLVAIAGEALAGRPAARWTAWLAALSPYLVQHAQEARMYALVTLLAAAQLALLLRWVAARARRLGGAFVLTALALVCSHYYTVFFVGGEVLVLLLLWRRPLGAWLPAALAAGALAGLGLLSAMLVASHRAGGSYAMGLAALPGALWALIAGYATLPDSAALHAEGARAALRFLPLALAGVVPVAACGVAGLRAVGRDQRLALLVPFGVVLAAPFAAHVVLGVAVNPRYLMAAAPCLLVLLGAGAARSPLAGPALAALLGAGLALHLAQPGHGREDTRSAGAWLDAHVPRDEEVLITSAEMELLADFQWPGRRFVLYPPPGVVAEADNAAQLAAALPFPASGRAIFVIGRAWLTDPAGALQRALAERYRPCPGVDVRGIRVLCLERAGGGS